MRYGSVCSGIEAATVAWDALGWEPAFFSEIEPYPCAALAHHYPDVPNYGDMTRFQEWPLAAIDVLVGGTPCQAFSVAGLRQGLADPRGNLTLTYLAIVERYRPEWVVWENVPGVLSDRTGAFGALLGGLAELGYGWAYRVLDAQYFGLAQRRKRVFVVGSARGWATAAAVLFERESLQGNPAPRRETGERTAPSLAGGTGGGCGHQYRQKGNEDAVVTHALRAEGFDASEDGTGRGIPLTVGALTAKGPEAMGAPEVDARHYLAWPVEVAPTLNAAFASKQGLEDQHALGGAGLFVPVTPSSGQAGASITADLAPALDCHEAPIVVTP